MELFTLALEGGIALGEALNVAATGMLVVLLVLALLAVLVWVLSKAVRAVESRGRKPASSGTAASIREKGAAVSVPAQIELTDVDEKTAAVLMAIVSKESGVPPERLRFVSIKALKNRRDQR